MQNLIIRKWNSNKIWRSIGPISRLTGNRQVHSHTGDTAVTNLLFLPWKVTTFENILFDFPSGPQTVCSDSTQVTWPKRPITVSFLCASRFEFDKKYFDLIGFIYNFLENFVFIWAFISARDLIFLGSHVRCRSVSSSSLSTQVRVNSPLPEIKKKSTEEVTCLRWPFRVSECVIVQWWGVEPFNSYVFNFSTNLNPLGRWCPLWTHFFSKSQFMENCPISDLAALPFEIDLLKKTVEIPSHWTNDPVAA